MKIQPFTILKQNGRPIRQYPQREKRAENQKNTACMWHVVPRQPKELTEWGVCNVDMNAVRVTPTAAAAGTAVKQSMTPTFALVLAARWARRSLVPRTWKYIYLDFADVSHPALVLRENVSSLGASEHKRGIRCCC